MQEMSSVHKVWASSYHPSIQIVHCLFEDDAWRIACGKSVERSEHSTIRHRLCWLQRGSGLSLANVLCISEELVHVLCLFEEGWGAVEL